jgi:inosose dehydratase
MSKISPTLDRAKVKLGVTPTLWWNDDFISIDIGITFGQCVSEMALAGFEGCSIGHKYPTDPKVLKHELQLRGLRASEPWVSTYFTINEMKEQTLRSFHQQMEFLKSLGGTDMVVAELGQAVHPLPVAVFANRPIFTDQQWNALFAGLNHLGKIANDNGMRLCYHPHMGTGVMIKQDIDKLMANTEPEFVHLLLDTGHLYFAGADPLEVTRQYGSRIKHIHLKDVRANIVTEAREKNFSFRDSVEAGVFTVPGDGDIKFEPILTALAEAKFEGWLVVEAEQDPAKAYPLVYAQKARNYLRQTLGW